MGSDRARQIWNRGIPLSEAWIAFATEAERADFDALPGGRTTLGSGVDSEAIRQPPGLAAFFTALTAAAVAAVDASTVKRSERERLQEDILDALFNCDLVAAAYRESPTTSSAPIAIEASAFDHAVPDWEHDQIHVHGKVYGRVRIFDPSAAALPVTGKRRGRQGSDAAIKAAIQSLAISIPNLCELDRKQACQKIRMEIGHKHTKGDGLSDVNLSKYLVQFCGKRRISAII